MRSDGFRRPRLCRLCECPVVDGGVILRKPRMDKVSRWWKAHFDADLEHETRAVCHFCVWDLRFADRNSEEKEPADQKWWPNYECKNSPHVNYYKYYIDGLVKPCFVKIDELANAEKLIQDYKQSTRHPCPYCPQSYTLNYNLLTHAKRDHPDEFIFCDKRGCDTYFHTQEERTEHIQKQHQKTDDAYSLKCLYCDKVSIDCKSNLYHMLKQHRSEIIRCKYTRCKKYFKTLEERDKHFDVLHNYGDYLCCFCSKRFESANSQWQHMKKYHKEKALKCNAARKCPNYFKTEEDRQKHVQEKHSEEHKCLYCSKTFNKKQTLRQHVNIWHKDVSLRCEFQCAIWFKSENDRYEHYKEHHKGKFSCPFCAKKRFRTILRLRYHLKTQHKKDKIFQCPYWACANYFSSKEDMLKHVKEAHKNHDDKFWCLYCDKFKPKRMTEHVKKWHKDVAIKCNFKENCPNYFKTLEDREKHVREVHHVEKVRKPLQCFHCDKILVGKQSFRSHINLKHAEIAIKCRHPQCGTFFKNQEDLEAHFSLKPKHRHLEKWEDSRRKIYCANCPSWYKCKSQLRSHILSKHLGVQDMCPYCKKLTTSRKDHVLSDFCKVCNQKFQCLGLLRSHAKKCKPVFHCPVCSKSFKRQCKLTYHCKTNHNVPILKWKGLQFESRGFKCQECCIYFSRKDHLTTHKKICNKSLKVTCDFCKKQFEKANLPMHILRHHLEIETKLHPCPICNLKLTRARGLRKHVERKHSNQELVQCKICSSMLKQIYLKKHMQLFH